MTVETPSPRMVMPYRASAASMVRRWWVMTMSCELSRSSSKTPSRRCRLVSSRAASTSSSHVERRGAGLEDGEQVGDRGQRALPAGQQRQPLDLLARRPGLDLDPGGQHVVRLGEQQIALAAGEQPGEQLLELPRRIRVRGREHLLHPVVDLLDHGEQVAPGLAQVFQLGREEGVPFGQGGVLLQGQRVDLAQPVELALGVGGPALGLGPVIAGRQGRLVAEDRDRGLRDRTRPPARRSRRRTPPVRDRTSWASRSRCSARAISVPCAAPTTVSRSAARSRARARTVFSSPVPPALAASASARRAWAWATDRSAASTA